MVRQGDWHKDRTPLNILQVYLKYIQQWVDKIIFHTPKHREASNLHIYMLFLVKDSETN